MGLNYRFHKPIWIYIQKLIGPAPNQMKTIFVISSLRILPDRNKKKNKENRRIHIYEMRYVILLFL